MLRALSVAIAAFYPLLVYAGLGRVEPRWIAVFLLGIAVLRALLVRDWITWFLVVGAAILAAVTFASNAALPLKVYPVLVSLGFLAVFAGSLYRGPSAIERIARLKTPDLPPEGVFYTRRVTQIWCAFFVFNAVVAAGLALGASDQIWALYTGLISYVLMALLFVGEWFFRARFIPAARHG